MIIDAKYRDHDTRPPSTGELYQLTTYGLAYGTQAPVPTLILHPTTRLGVANVDTPHLRFQPAGQSFPVDIRLVGAPISEMLNDDAFDAWSTLVAPFL